MINLFARVLYDTLTASVDAVIKMMIKRLRLIIKSGN